MYSVMEGFMFIYFFIFFPIVSVLRVDKIFLSVLNSLNTLAENQLKLYSVGIGSDSVMLRSNDLSFLS